MTDMGVPPAGSGSRAPHEAAKASSPEASIPNAMEARLQELLALEFNWNSYRAQPIDPACAERVRRLYPVMETLGLQPWITPDNNGGLSIERAGTDDYSVEFRPDGSACVYFDDLTDKDALGFVGLFAQIRALDAIAMETRRAERPRQGTLTRWQSDDSAGRRHRP